MGREKKYRKKPVVVKAAHLGDDMSLIDAKAWIRSEGGQSTVALTEDGRAGLHIHTLEGTMTGFLGDYLIQGVKGEFYPCKADIFEETYERETT